MAVFERIDGKSLSERIMKARTRVVLCIPGFGDDVGSALISVYRRLPHDNVTLIVDGSDQAARLGYGHFDAIKQVSDSGVNIRIEHGLRLGIAVIDDHGWCFATPPLLVDATMEGAVAPNAMTLGPAQVEAALAAVIPVAQLVPGNDPTPELGQHVALVSDIEQTYAALQADPPQRFDVARKVNVFNAFVEFVELELLGTQLGRQRVPLPPALLLAVSDETTRDRLTTSFQLIGEDSELGKRARELRRQMDAIRKEHTRAIGHFGSIGLRANRARLEQALATLKKEVKQFQTTARERLQKEIDRSRKQLVESVLPGLKKAPPEALLSSIVGKPTVDQLRRWIEQQLDRSFPPLDRLIAEMKVTVAFKGVTYETLNDTNFQAAVRKAYPLVDFDKPFREFAAAQGDDQPDLTGL
jgi:hypothetical protein